MLSLPYAGVSRVRFEGFALSRVFFGTAPLANRKIIAEIGAREKELLERRGGDANAEHAETFAETAENRAEACDL